MGPVPVLLRQLRHLAERRPRRIVDQDVDAPVAFRRQVNRVLEVLIARHVGLHELCGDSLLCKSVGGFDTEFPVDFGDNDSRALLAEPASRGPPDPVARPGHERHFAIQLPHFISPCFAAALEGV